MPAVKNWLEPIDREIVPIGKIAEELKISSKRVLQGLEADRKNIFEGNRSEVDFLKHYTKLLNRTKSIGEVRAQWAGYLSKLEESTRVRLLYSSDQAVNPNILNLFIWNLAHRFKLNSKPT